MQKKKTLTSLTFIFSRHRTKSSNRPPHAWFQTAAAFSRLKRVGNADALPVPTHSDDMAGDTARAWTEHAHKQTEVIPYDSVLLFSSIIF